MRLSSASIHRVLTGLTWIVTFASTPAQTIAQSPPYLPAANLSHPYQSVVVKAKEPYLESSSGRSGTTNPASAGGRHALFRELTAALGISESKPLWQTREGLSAAGGLRHPGVSTFAVAVPAGQTAEDLVSELSQLPWVEYAEVDRLLELHAAPNDPLYPRMWHLTNSGQAHWSVQGIPGSNNDVLIERTGHLGADVRFLSVYESSDPTADILVGVIDTGLDSGHVDIRERVARNPGEIPGNGIDDDNNGFIDDVAGWDFSGDDASLTPISIVGDADARDDNGHGTHVAGTIASTVNNGIGIAGVCANARVIGIKIFPNSYFSISASAIYYAVNRGVRVINMSWGGSFRSRAIEDALQYAHDRGVVAIASMGNSGRDEIFYPSGYASTIGVGSSTSRDFLSNFSTYNDFVDLVAPGQDILSLRAAGTDLYRDAGEPDVHIIDEHYLIASGTSMSAPHASGAAACLLSLAPGLSNVRVREILQASADDIVQPFDDDSLSLPGFDRYTGAGRINLERALTMLPGVLVEITSHPPGAQLGQTDTIVSGRLTGANASGLKVELAAHHPPYAIDWETLPLDRTVLSDGGFTLRLPEAASLSGPFTLRVDAGVDAMLKWPLWFGSDGIASIHSPATGDTIQLLRPIVGSAYAYNFTSYSLTAIGPLPIRESHPIVTSSQFRWQDTLAYWRTDSLSNGLYDVVLTVVSTDGITRDSVRVEVRDAFLSGFPVDLPAPTHFAVATVNLDGIDGEEIICPTSRGLYVLQSDGSIYPGWPRATDFDVTAAPAVADLDRDGKSEIVVAGTSYMHVYAFIGEPFAGWPQPFLGGTGVFGNSIPVVGDMDRQGGLEVAAIDRHGRIKAWHADGSIYAPKGGEFFARIEVAGALANALPRLAICDLDGDRHPELIAAGDGIFVFDALSGEPFPGNDSAAVARHRSVHGLVIGDFNGDSRFEIAYTAVESGTDRFKLHVIDPSGVPLDGWPRQIPQPVNLYLLYSLSAGDIDGDHRAELFFAPYSLGEGYLYGFHGDGSPVGSDSTNGLLAELPGTISAVTLVNIDHTDDPEIVVRVGEFISGPDRIYALKPDGGLLPGYPIFFGDGNSVTMPAPIIGDLDADGMLDMTTVQSTSMSVAVWELNVPANAKGRPWPRFGGDLWNSCIAPAPRYDVIYLVRLIDMIFRGGHPLPPFEPSDLNCDGTTTVADVMALIDYMFRRGPHPCKP
jgi:subtilisin family serine protease